MSYSQDSGSQYGVSHYTNSFIDPELLQSNDFPGDAISSQFVTHSNSVFEDPSLPRYTLPPTSLQRVGKPLQQHYILYNGDKANSTMDTSRTQFVEWWLTTEFGLKKDLRRTINWDSDQKKSAAWSSFDQVAHSKTGEPKVMCKRCCAVVIHPGYKRSGPSPMKNHLKSAQCAKPQFQKTSKQGIDKLLQNMVCLPFNKSISLLIFP